MIRSFSSVATRQPCTYTNLSLRLSTSTRCVPVSGTAIPSTHHRRRRVLSSRLIHHDLKQQYFQSHRNGFLHISRQKRPSSSTSSKPSPPNTSTYNNKINVEKLEEQLHSLQSELQQLTYLIKQSQIQNTQTQTLARRAEARAYIIENKLMDIQSHVVKIPVSLQALESLGANVSSQVAKYLKDYSPHLLSETFKRVGGSELLTNKYTAWMLLGSILVFWQYRLTMYQRTSEEVANVAAMTLQQDSLRKTILETLTTVANSPETLSSLSSLFQSLISEERTEQHLINLIVRALNSEGVRLAAIQLLQVCFQDPNLQSWGGEFLKVAAKNTVLDEGVQKSAGVGIQKALKSAVLVPLPWWKQHHDVDEQQQKQSTGKDNEDEDGDNNGGIGEVNDLSGGKTPDTNNTTK